MAPPNPPNNPAFISYALFNYSCISMRGGSLDIVIKYYACLETLSYLFNYSSLFIFSIIFKEQNHGTALALNTNSSRS